MSEDARKSPRRLVAALLGILLVALTTGCGGSGGKRVAMITRDPGWPYTKYERIAVVPFQVLAPIASRPGIGEAAAQATYLVEEQLTANGAFTVLSRDALKDVLTEQDLSRLADVADPATVIPAGKIQAAQALVMGIINVYDLEQTMQLEQRPIYARDRQGRILFDRAGRPVVARVEQTPIYRHAAKVGGSLRVYDTATGTVLKTVRIEPVERDASSRGSPPAESAPQLARECAIALATGLYEGVAPIRKEVKLDKDSLVIASNYLDGEYAEIRKLPSAREKFIVAVRGLPKEAEFNSFRLVVATKEGAVLFEQQFTWTGANPVRGMQYEIPVRKLTDTGGSEFFAKLYSGADEEPVLTQSITIEYPKESARGASRDASARLAVD